MKPRNRLAAIMADLDAEGADREPPTITSLLWQVGSRLVDVELHVSSVPLDARRWSGWRISTQGRSWIAIRVR